uniref:ATP synthase complex subunit 8 n=1 Tax=Sphaerocoris annulus TaxID=1277805 RepID=A0A2P1CM23_9HEMI|nr:ATP synthase F0 subunit 8 [Sphaerocoris annulus]
MPQMSPLYWEALFMMFIISLILMSTIIYHHPKIQSQSKMKSTTLSSDIDWKW